MTTKDQINIGKLITEMNSDMSSFETEAPYQYDPSREDGSMNPQKVKLVMLDIKKYVSFLERAISQGSFEGVRSSCEMILQTMDEYGIEFDDGDNSNYEDY
jgi:hypothetical protein